MAKLLTIDTSSMPCAVAVCEGDFFAVKQAPAEQRAAQMTLLLIQDLLAESDWTLPDLDAIAVVTGPGSFTGMRVGVGIAQGLALATNTPVVPVSALAVIAQQAYSLEPEFNRWLIAMPAREPEIYLGGFSFDASGELALDYWEGTGVPGVLGANLTQLHTVEWAAAGTAWGQGAALLSDLGVDVRPCLDELSGSLRSACQLGVSLWRRQCALPADKVLPNYIKEHLDYS